MKQFTPAERVPSLDVAWCAACIAVRSTDRLTVARAMEPIVSGIVAYLYNSYIAQVYGG